MAIKKEFVSSNGAKALYHRIKSIEKTAYGIKVTLSCYADETYRDKEKEISDIRKNQNSLRERKNELKIKSLEDSLTKKETAEYEDIINKLDSVNFVNRTNFEVFTHDIIIPYTDGDDISFDGVYTLIKEEEIFKNAEDC